jgi:hypothetical protein
MVVDRHCPGVAPEAAGHLGGQGRIELLLHYRQLLHPQLLLEIAPNGLRGGRPHQVRAHRLDGAFIGSDPHQEVEQIRGGALVAVGVQGHVLLEGAQGMLQHFWGGQFRCILRHRLVLLKLFRRTNNLTEAGSACLLFRLTREPGRQIWIY